MWQPQKLKLRYEILADFMIANPRASYAELGEQLGLHANTVGMIVRSDIFQEYLRQRRDRNAEEFDGAVREKVMKTADRSLDLILDVMEKKRDNIPLGQLLQINERAMDALGYGGSAKAQPAVNVNVQQNNQTVAAPVAREVLESARATVRQLEAHNSAKALPALKTEAEPQEQEVSGAPISVSV